MKKTTRKKPNNKQTKTKTKQKSTRQNKQKQVFVDSNAQPMH